MKDRHTGAVRTPEPGDKFRTLAMADNGATVLATVTAERVVMLNDGVRFRIECPCPEGVRPWGAEGEFHLIVGIDGRDRHGYVEPA